MSASETTVRQTGRSRVRRLGLLVLLLGACAGALYYATHKPGGGSAPSAQARAVPVTTALVSTETVQDELPAYGNLRARRAVDITAPQAGQVRQILFADGATVAANAPLVVLDDRIAVAQLESDRAQFLKNQEDLRRIRALAQQGLESTRSVEQAQSQLASALSQVRIGEARLSFATLRAPFAGTLGTRLVDEGAVVSAGDRLVTIEDRSRLLVDVRVPSRYLPQLHTGLEVSLDVPEFGTKLATGRLTLVDTTVSTDTRSILVRAEVDNADGRLLPGLFVRDVIQLGTRPDAVVIPDQALVHDLVGAYVFVVQDGVASRRLVQLGDPHGGRVEVMQGLARGERIVTVGAFRLHDGDRIEELPALTGGGA